MLNYVKRLPFEDVFFYWCYCDYTGNYCVSKENMFKHTLKWQKVKAEIIAVPEGGRTHSLCKHWASTQGKISKQYLFPYRWLWELGWSETVQGACAKVLNPPSQEMYSGLCNLTSSKCTFSSRRRLNHEPGAKKSCPKQRDFGCTWHLLPVVRSLWAVFTFSIWVLSRHAFLKVFCCIWFYSLYQEIAGSIWNTLGGTFILVLKPSVLNLLSNSSYGLFLPVTLDNWGQRRILHRPFNLQHTWTMCKCVLFLQPYFLIHFTLFKKQGKNSFSLSLLKKAAQDKVLLLKLAWLIYRFNALQVLQQLIVPMLQMSLIGAVQCWNVFFFSSQCSESFGRRKVKLSTCFVMILFSFQSIDWMVCPGIFILLCAYLRFGGTGNVLN